MKTSSAGFRGFTLIELLIAITIVAILSAIGFVTYSGVQKSARDTIRQTQIIAIAAALEASKNSSTGTYTLTITSLPNEFPITETRPREGVDPKDIAYCVKSNTTTSVPPDDAESADAWTKTVCNPTGPTGYETLNSSVTTGTLSLGTAKAWTLCAKLEARIGVFCMRSKST